MPLQDGADPGFADRNEVCMFGLSASGSNDRYLFGDTFLRSAYVFHDLDNNQVGIAPVASDSIAKSPHIITVTHGTGGDTTTATSATSATVSTGIIRSDGYGHSPTTTATIWG
ncbi:hypothetical protein LTR78_003241 [Recurvomyces mirabilis]|uniref:Peptidase A1 domain-containing protein n=1 Tax=Recurvomyces mirabilis TaxID=574656 RepID=A0AAE0WS38_9PEZI|nr:hypothetical protein LTR78_003241 [Recurvomyces mirabilis]KAK5156942.1 hypothetical protein LTS14_004459 [Recurvomyces mirabilis]